MIASEEDYSLEKKVYKYCGVELSYASFTEYIEKHGMFFVFVIYVKNRFLLSSILTLALLVKEWNLFGTVFLVKPRSCSPKLNSLE